jgi:hypothetical protein
MLTVAFGGPLRIAAPSARSRTRRVRAARGHRGPPTPGSSRRVVQCHSLRPRAFSALAHLPFDREPSHAQSGWAELTEGDRPPADAGSPSNDSRHPAGRRPARRPPPDLGHRPACELLSRRGCSQRPRLPPRRLPRQPSQLRRVAAVVARRFRGHPPRRARPDRHPWGTPPRCTRDRSLAEPFVGVSSQAPRRPHAGGRKLRGGATRLPAACARMGFTVRSWVQPTVGVPGNVPMSGGR